MRNKRKIIKLTYTEKLYKELTLKLEEILETEESKENSFKPIKGDRIYL